MVSAFVSVWSGPGSSPGRAHCVVFLGKTQHTPGGSRNTPSRFMPDGPTVARIKTLPLPRLH